MSDCRSGQSIVDQALAAGSMDLSNWTLSPHNPLLRPSKAEDSAVMAGSLLQGGGGIAEGDRACGPNGASESILLFCC